MTEEQKEKECAVWDSRFDRIADPKTREAVRDFYREFYDPEKLIRWWAGLYDPDLGGFYYADSARDTEGFLPDMESTLQIAQRLRPFGPDGDLAAYLGPEITAKMIAFYQSKQDPEDGYFYHPQWTRETSRAKVMRYTRDQDWAIAVLRWLHSAPLYPTALDRAKNADRTAHPTATQDWEPNVASVTAYVNNLFATRSCESWSNTLQTQATTFEAAGMLDTVIDILDSKMNPEYGLWVTGYDPETDSYFNLKDTPEPETPYGLYTCAYKLMIMYNAAGRLVPSSTKMVENAIKAIKSRDPGIRVTYIFNPWATLGTVRTNLNEHGTPALTEAYDALIRENVLDMLDAAKCSLGKYRWADGSYSFLQSGSSPTIYGTPVSLGEKEGDVNGNNLVVSFARHICSAIGLSEMIPVFSPRDAALMKELMVNAPKIVKRNPAPV